MSYLIVLNGTSSSGKSALALAIQKQLVNKIHIHLAVDTFLECLPSWVLEGSPKHENFLKAL